MRFPKLTLPAASPSDEPTEMICLNHDWVIELISLSERLEFDAAWLLPIDELDMTTKALELQQILVRASAMGCCCKQPTNRRYNENGQLEVSYDNGATWTVDNSLDDRFSGAQSPPLAGADGDEKRCLGAAAGMEYVKQNWMDTLAEGASYANINGAGVAVTLALGVTGVGILLAAAAAAIFIAGVSAAQAAFTSGVWADYQCILYCNSSDDASFTTEQWQAVKAAILAQFTGVVSAVLYNWVNTVGPVGLTNSARSGMAAAADCSECDCPLCFDETAIQNGTFVGIGTDGTGNYIEIASVFIMHNSLLNHWVTYGGEDFCCYYTGFAVTEGAITAGGLLDCDGNFTEELGFISFVEFRHDTDAFTIKFYFS